MDPSSPSEPMLLGSPLGPRGTAGNPGHQTPHGNQFLPGFLLGDLPQSNTSMMQQPQAPMMSGIAKSQQGTSALSGMRMHGSVHFPSDSSRFMTFDSEQQVKENPGTPPVKTLIDDLAAMEKFTTDQHNHSMSENSYLRYQDTNTPQRGRLGGMGRTQHQPSSPLSPVQNTLISQQHNSTMSPHTVDVWVTVFGFLPSYASLVLKRFSQFGTILEYHMAPNNGNWMHIKFENSLQSKKALSRHGKLWSENMMLGVIPCTDLDFKESSQILSPATPSRPANTLRPLSAAYNASAATSQVNSPGTPLKSNTMLTKAMDYFFG